MPKVPIDDRWMLATIKSLFVPRRLRRHTPFVGGLVETGIASIHRVVDHFSDNDVGERFRATGAIAQHIGICARHTDRLWRNNDIMGKLLRILRVHGIELWDFNSRFEYKSAHGRFSLQVLGAASELEIGLIAERIREMKRGKAVKMCSIKGRRAISSANSWGRKGGLGGMGVRMT